MDNYTPIKPAPVDFEKLETMHSHSSGHPALTHRHTHPVSWWNAFNFKRIMQARFHDMLVDIRRYIIDLSLKTKTPNIDITQAFDESLDEIEFGYTIDGDSGHLQIYIYGSDDKDIGRSTNIILAAIAMDGFTNKDLAMTVNDIDVMAPISTSWSPEYTDGIPFISGVEPAYYLDALKSWIGAECFGDSSTDPMFDQDDSLSSLTYTNIYLDRFNSLINDLISRVNLATE